MVNIEEENIMSVTLLLPSLVPYGNPVTFFKPAAHYKRKSEFFRWVHSVEDESKEYQHVPLYIYEEIEKHKNTFIIGEQTADLDLVP